MASRAFVPTAGPTADANVRPRHPADAAQWIWHPGYAIGVTGFLRFRLEFELTQSALLPLHVSADQRYQLWLDDQEMGYGPDRSDVKHWSVATHEVQLGQGAHRLEALVWWIADDSLTGLRGDPLIAGDAIHTKPPIAQMSWRGGFLLASDETHARQLNTAGQKGSGRCLLICQLIHNVCSR